MTPPLDQAPGVIATLLAVGAVLGAWKGFVVFRVRNGNGRNAGAAAKLVEERHERVMGALGALEIAITDLGKAVAELRLWLAERD